MLHLNIFNKSSVLLWICKKEKPFTEQQKGQSIQLSFYILCCIQNAQCTKASSIENGSSNHLQNGNSGTVNSREIQFAIEILKSFIVMSRATGHGAWSIFKSIQIENFLCSMNKNFNLTFWKEEKVLCPQKSWSQLT